MRLPTITIEVDTRHGIRQIAQAALKCQDLAVEAAQARLNTELEVRARLYEELERAG